jgi:hypothetical protein
MAIRERLITIDEFEDILAHPASQCPLPMSFARFRTAA